MILKDVPPIQLRPGDCVLVNGSFWKVRAIGALCVDHRAEHEVGWHMLRLEANGDFLIVKRTADAKLTVSRTGQGADSAT